MYSSSSASPSYRDGPFFSQASDGTEPLPHKGLDLTWVNNQGLVYAAILCSVVSCVVSFADLREHLARLDYPKLQVLEMRIILMIPIYAIFSALSLVFVAWRFFFETIRDTYESFVLYIFFMLMIAYCGGEGQLLRSLKRKRYRGVHPFPMCWLPSYPLDTDFYLRCKRWVLQCALIKPITSFIAMIAHPLGIYQEGSFALDNVYTYNCIIINLSLTWALYYLVLFEIECGKEMHYAKTFLKFLCIKSIIFFSYWQSVGINVMSSGGFLYLGADEHERERTSSTIQDLLMCFELLPVAFMHRAAFGREKLDEEMAAVPVYMKDNNSGSLRTNVDTALNVNDIIDDTVGTIFYRRGKLMDLENNEEDSDDVAGDAEYDQAAAERRMRSATGGDADALARDPTLEELVRHAVTTDYGVRVDGVLHYDEDEDREALNQDMNYTDTDVILHRSKAEAAGSEVRVDTDLLSSNQVKHAGAPQIYCVVCGRFDREMVRRRNGYKCRECVGSKSQSLLSRRQREADRPDEQQLAESSTGGRFGGQTTAVTIEDLPVDEDDNYVQAIQVDADLAGVTAPRDETSAAAALAEGITNLNAKLLAALNVGDQATMMAAQAASGGTVAAGGAAAANANCRVCGMPLVPVDGGKWRCTRCVTDLRM